MCKLKTVFLSFALCLLYWSLAAQLTFQITEVPSNTPMSDVLYLAGNFNGWNEKDDNYQLTNNNNGTYSITFSPAPGLLEFKFTRGSWSTVEGNSSGGFRPNREYNYSGGAAAVELTILSWEDLGGSGGQSTATDNVFLLDQDFYIPQLNRNRRIWIYLPPDYETSGKRYPVIYMQDGQNLFDAYTSFSGEWEVDESLNRLFDQGDRGAIIVGIANGGAERIDEYTPWTHPTYGGGEGELYVDFIVQTLKPYIDTNYRTRADRDHTGIMGSSLGGLISMYAAIKHQDVFSKAGIFSPSFWFSEEAYTQVSTTGKQADMRFYLLAGELESNGSVVDDIERMRSTLLSAGFSDTDIVVDADPDGQHSEWYWRREFPGAYLWLCQQSSTAATEAASPVEVQIFPNPADKILKLVWKGNSKKGSYRLLGLRGEVYVDQPFTADTTYIRTEWMPSGVYVLNVFDKGVRVDSQKILLQH